MRFSTTDKDQDTSGTINCAVEYTGAFWYHKFQYLNGENNQPSKGMTWYAFKGGYYSLKTTQMKFRPDYIKD